MAELEHQSNSGELGKDDILDILKEDDADNQDDKGKDKTPAKSAKEEEGEEDIDEEGDEEIEEDEDEEDEDAIGDEDEDKELKLDDEEAKPFPKKQEILKEFPNLFKKFPGIEAAIYRDRQFSEVFPTPEDAKEASDKAQVLDEYSNELANGNVETLLKNIKENDEVAFYRIADSFLHTVSQIDQRAYHHIIGNIVKFTVMAMAEEAKGSNDEELMSHAAALNKFVFRTDKWNPPQRLVNNTQDPQAKQVADERVAIAQERFESAQSGLQTKVDKALKAAISTYIDPKDEMSEYVKSKASQDAFEAMETLLSEDRVLRATLNRLWKASHGEKYSSSSLDKIRAAYLSKAKTYLKDVLKDARSKALRTTKRRESDGERKVRRGPIPPGRSSGSSGGKTKEIPKGMSNKDFIMSD